MAHARDRDEQGPSPLLVSMLEVAVPMWIERLRCWPWAEKMKRRDACLEALGIETDDQDLLSGIALLVSGATGKKGQVANAFNRMAEALAILALNQGGVTLFGVHWEAPRMAPAPPRPLSLSSMLLRCSTCGRPEAWTTPTGAAAAGATSSR